jgi:single-strand DNA-binding protein
MSYKGEITMSINKVILSGNLTRDPDVKYTQSGTAVATFSIAVNDGYGDNQKTYYPNIVVWGKTAETVGKNLTKGSKVGVVGKLTSRSYESNGQKKYITEIVADMYGGIEFLGSKKQSQSNEIDSEEVPF